MRFDDRKGPNGEKILFIEEAAETIGTEGTGKRDIKVKPQKTEGWEAEARPHGGFTESLTRKETRAGYSLMPKRQKKRSKWLPKPPTMPNAVPDAPFKKTLAGTADEADGALRGRARLRWHGVDSGRATGGAVRFTGSKWTITTEVAGTKEHRGSRGIDIGEGADYLRQELRKS